MFNPITKRRYDFVGNLKIYLSISLGIFLIGLIMLAVFGLKMDIDFSGGTIVEYSFTGEINQDEADETIRGALDFPFQTDVKTPFATEDKSYLTVTLTEKTALSVEQVDAVTNALAEKYAEQNLTKTNQNSVSPTVGAALFTKALYVLLLAMIFLTVYIGIRFRKIGGISAGVFALVALIHDMIFAFFVFVIFRLSLDMNFIAVELTILGYSLNDTIVIYDRIREEEKRHGTKKTVRELTNYSINKTLGRTLSTSAATFAAILTVCIVAYAFGLESIISFALPMAFGVISGSYSTICLAGPLWVRWQEHQSKKTKSNGKKKKK
jgi:preprotein translocase subunit SecF